MQQIIYEYLTQLTAQSDHWSRFKEGDSVEDAAHSEFN